MLEVVDAWLVVVGAWLVVVGAFGTTQLTPGISTNSVVVVDSGVVGAEVVAVGPLAIVQVPPTLEQLAYSEHKSAKSPFNKEQNSPGELPV